ncbi:MAG: tetratricopeptide repeat protein [Myxococcales bacterium]|nr:tetratricopeptide repeat protein [Myxococcales bacterium]
MWTVALILLLGAASEPSPLLQAEQAFEALEFDRAAKLFQAALASSGSREERLRAWRGLGLSHAFQGDVRAARAVFEKLLLLDPSAEVEKSLGPKIATPFEQARKAVGSKRNHLLLERMDSGAVRLLLREDVPWASALFLHARPDGSSSYSLFRGRPGEPVSASFAPEVAVEAWAEARDQEEGVLYSLGSASRPQRLAPVARPELPPAIRAAVEEPPEEPPPRENPRWPIFLGAGAAVGVGIVAAVLLSQPPELKLPAADRTRQLP